MYTLILIAVLGQVPAPPSPGIVSVPSAYDTIPTDSQAQREWLYARLIVDAGFNDARIKDLKQKLDRMTPEQIGTLCRHYQMTREQARQEQTSIEQARQAMVMGQAQLNLQKAQAYRDHLARQYQYEMFVKQQELEVLRTGNNYVNMAMSGVFGGWGGYNPYSSYSMYGPPSAAVGYRGYGYGNWSPGFPPPSLPGPVWRYSGQRGYGYPIGVPFTIPNHIHRHR